MNLLLTVYLSAILYGGSMESVMLKEGIYLNVWHAGSKTYAQVESNGKFGAEHVVRNSPCDYVSVVAISPNLAKATYSDGTTKILHIIDECVTVLDEKEKQQ